MVKELVINIPDIIRNVFNACLEDHAFLDVANASNPTKWPKIIEALRVEGFPLYFVSILESYLCDWTVEYEGSSRASTCGVPQGSVLSYSC